MQGLPNTAAQIGTTVGGRYRLEAALGEGGQGAVFGAVDQHLGRSVAVKVLHALAHGQRDQLERFRHEAELAKGLSHPNTVRILDFGYEPLPFIVYERLIGRGLDELLAAGPLAEDRVAAVASGVLKSLMEAHAAGIVHRDIKPANIFLCDYHGEHDFVKVLDFGIATTAERPGITQVGHAVGTPQYMAPEQVHGHGVGPPTDLYALGITMAEMLSGHPLVIGQSPAEIASKQISAEPIVLPPSVLRSSLGSVVHRATRKEIGHRFASAAEMLEAIGALRAPAMVVGDGIGFAQAPTDLAGVTPAWGPHAVAGTPVHRTGGPPTKRAKGGMAYLLAGILLLIGAVVAGVFVFARDKPTTSQDEDGPRKREKEESDGAEALPAANVGWFNLHAAIARVDGDGVDDVVGMCDVGGAIALCAISGATFELLWSADETMLPGHIEEVLVIGGLAVAVTSQGIVQAHELATGKRIRSTQSFVSPAEICAPSDHPGSIWIESRLPTHKEILVDVRSGAMRDFPQPATCPVGHTRTDSCSVSRKPHRDAWCRGLALPGRISGMAADRVYVTADEGVVLGHRSDGPAYDMIAGYQVLPDGQGKVRWSRPFNDGDPAAAESRFAQAYARERNASVGGGRIVAVSASSVAAFAVDSGKTLWRLPRGEVRGAIVAGDRAYLLASRGVSVVRADDGTPVGRIGSP